MCFGSRWSVSATTSRSISNIHITTHSPHSWWFAPNGWEDMTLHELAEIMRQKDVHFAQNLNKIWLAVPEEGSEEDRMLQGCELKVMKMMTVTQKMWPMSMHKISTAMNGIIKG